MSITAYCKKINFLDYAPNQSPTPPNELNFFLKSGLLKKGESYLKKHDDYFVFHKENFGTFEIYKDSINYDLVKKFTNNVNLSIYLNQPMACNAYLNDFLVMHCSAFYYKNYSYLILGRSGSGKSTLLFHMLKHAKFVTEDIGILDEQNYIFPSYPIAKITDDNFSEKFLESKSKIPFDDRRRYSCLIKKKYFKTEPAPVGGIFFLKRCEKENITALSLTEKISAIYSSSLRLIEDADNEYEKKFFQKASVLAKCKAFKINIPVDEDAPTTAKKLIKFLDENL